jgi:hypothetical protein
VRGAAEIKHLEIKPESSGQSGAPLQPVPDVRPARAGSRVVRGQRARGVVSFYLRTLAPEGRMTVIIGRRLGIEQGVQRLLHGAPQPPGRGGS